MKKLKILVVDDEKNICRSMKMILSGEGHEVFTAETASQALAQLETQVPDLIFLDVLLPDEDGLSLLGKIKARFPTTEVVMISGHATLKMAVEATRAGAYDFFEKPLQKEKILILIRNLSETRELRHQFQEWQKERFGEYQMIGQSAALQQVREQIERVAPTNSKVLISGESGTGKELVAWAIHHKSSRREGPFIKMNCAAIPDELTESELFGYEKGAFTGATATRDGKFLLADGGTLFLDEIADMSLRVQTKVLRVLQDGRFERVGGRETLQVDVRVIAATNKDLEALVRQGKFREDLYFRLNVFPIRVPPLRERPEDIPLLLDYFIQKYCQENNRRVARVEDGVVQALRGYSWPGNVRELRNLVERLLILTTGETIRLPDLPAHLMEPSLNLTRLQPGSKSLKEVREMAEREYIQRCLKFCNGNVSQAAKLLKLERTNLHKKMKALGIRSKTDS